MAGARTYVCLGVWTWKTVIFYSGIDCDVLIHGKQEGQSEDLPAQSDPDMELLWLAENHSTIPFRKEDGDRLICVDLEEVRTPDDDETHEMWELFALNESDRPDDDDGDDVMYRHTVLWGQLTRRFYCEVRRVGQIWADAYGPEEWPRFLKRRERMPPPASSSGKRSWGPVDPAVEVLWWDEEGECLAELVDHGTVDGAPCEYLPDPGGDGVWVDDLMEGDVPDYDVADVEWEDEPRETEDEESVEI